MWASAGIKSTGGVGMLVNGGARYLTVAPDTEGLWAAPEDSDLSAGLMVARERGLLPRRSPFLNSAELCKQLSIWRFTISRPSVSVDSTSPLLPKSLTMSSRKVRFFEECQI